MVTILAKRDSLPVSSDKESDHGISHLGVLLGFGEPDLGVLRICPRASVLSGSPIGTAGG
jgi:hypothetical protein